MSNLVSTLIWMLKVKEWRELENKTRIKYNLLANSRRTLVSMITLRQSNPRWAKHLPPPTSLLAGRLRPALDTRKPMTPSIAPSHRLTNNRLIAKTPSWIPNQRLALQIKTQSRGAMSTTFAKRTLLAITSSWTRDLQSSLLHRKHQVNTRSRGCLRSRSSVATKAHLVWCLQVV